jgi:hypothetical protein
MSKIIAIMVNPANIPLLRQEGDVMLGILRVPGVIGPLTGTGIVGKRRDNGHQGNQKDQQHQYEIAFHFLPPKALFLPDQKPNLPV